MPKKLTLGEIEAQVRKLEFSPAGPQILLATCLEYSPKGLVQTSSGYQFNYTQIVDDLLLYHHKENNLRYEARTLSRLNLLLIGQALDVSKTEGEP